MEVLDLMKRSGRVLYVMVVAGGLFPTPSSQTSGGRHPLISKEKVEERHRTAKAFQCKVGQRLSLAHTDR